MNDLLSLLTTGKPYREDELCERLNLSLAQLQQQFSDLRKAGYRITCEGIVGLRLVPVFGSLLPGYIRMELQTRRMGRGDILYATEMGSTNTELKQAALVRDLPEGSLAVCDRQTAGKGRLQRAWETPEAGTALPSSLLLTPKLPPEQVQLVTLAAAVAAAAAIADFDLAPGIKWPNDVVLGSRKCVGILCEMAADMGGVRFVIAGVGFNVNQRAFPQELSQKATSLWLESGREIDRRALLCRYLWHMERAMDTLESKGLAGLMPEYTARSVTLGRRVQVIGATDTFVGIAESMDDTGALFVRDDQGALRRVLSADVSVRGVMGYV